MGRALRIYHPGSAFHIVARTQGKEPWFADDLKDRIADLLLTGIASVDARVLAFAVMDNHFHVLLFQGRATLGEIMQPPLRRIALLIQKVHGRSGHVFERRFRAKQCNDSEHLPNAIIYIHRNPVASGRCALATDYRWSSANAYESNCSPGILRVDDGLRAFDTFGCSPIESLRQLYRDRLSTQGTEELDGYWSWFTRSVRRRKMASSGVPFSIHAHRAPLRDLRDVALNVLRSIDNAIDMQLVRSRYGGRDVARVRAQLIAALLQRGYSGVDIAGYLRISQSSVSRIRSAMRWAAVSAIS